MKSLLKLLSFGLIAQTTIAKPTFSCQSSQSEGIDFFCADQAEPTPYQPCANFKLAYGQASSNTSLWFIGERHDQSKKTVNCINTLTQTVGEHTVYLEGAKAGKIVKCESYRGLKAKKGRVCKGWDDPAAVAKYKTYVPELEDVDLKEKMAGHLLELEESFKGLDDKTADAQLKYLRFILTSNAGAERIKKLSGKLVDTKTMIPALDWLLEQRKNGTSYKDAFATPIEVYEKIYEAAAAKNPKALDSKALKKLDQKREQDLLTTADEHPQSRFGIFVVGENHLKKKFVKDNLEQRIDNRSIAVLVK
ncbi:MAG TPA: hypothetical protein VLI69_00635 [Gammaproteobacteria bacterium]|nr:hypothetical protein [Gammaproteobacteria bacterium]